MFVSGLSNTRRKQLSLFDIDDSNGTIVESDNEKLQIVIDDIRNKYGSDIIKYGSNK